MFSPTQVRIDPPPKNKVRIDWSLAYYTSKFDFDPLDLVIIYICDLIALFGL